VLGAATLTAAAVLAAQDSWDAYQFVHVASNIITRLLQVFTLQTAETSLIKQLKILQVLLGPVHQ
jgi:hypothetical protein